MSESLPVIDISPLRSGEIHAPWRAQIAAACRDSGFFYVSGHGVPAELLAGPRRREPARSSPCPRRTSWRSRWRAAAGPGAASSRSAAS